MATGQAIVRVERIDDVDARRAKLRRQARADRIRIRTGVTDGTLAWALLVDSVVVEVSLRFEAVGV
jgi:hypothetical protein